MPRSYPPVSFIGVPTDIGAGHRGASLGPEALRIAGLATVCGLLAAVAPARRAARLDPAQAIRL